MLDNAAALPNNPRRSMIRKILGGLAGYVVYFFSLYLFFIGFSVALGPDRLFRAGNYDPSVTWFIGVFLLGVIAAVIGGYIAALIGERGAVRIMAGIVAVICTLVFVMLFKEDKTVEARTVELPTMDAMFKAREPLWFAGVNPILIVSAVLLGGTLRTKRTKQHEN
jgi:MFS family permease